MQRVAKDSMSLTSRIYSRNIFESEFTNALSSLDSSSKSSLSSTDMTILLTYLSRDKPILSFNDTTVKISPPNITQPEPITEQDITIANLRTLITSLSSQIDTLSTRITTLNTSIKTLITEKKTTQARSALRSRKQAESTLGARSDTLAQLETVFASIEQAADQVAIVRVMESSAFVLRSLNKQVGGTERVEDVVDSLREEMDKVDEVGKVITEPVAGAIDEGEVDDELEALETAEREKREAVEKTEREKSEKEEAEQVRLRLETLQSVPVGKKEEAPKAAAQEAEVEGQKKDTQPDIEMAESPERLDGKERPMENAVAG